MLKGKYIYKAGIDGDLTIEEQIEQVKTDSIRGGYSTRDFSASLRYDITRTVANIFGMRSYDRGQKYLVSAYWLSQLDFHC